MKPSSDFQGALRPIASLLSKSEKARQKLAPGTWQHTMLRGNLGALRLALALMSEETSRRDRFIQDDLQEALRALGSMIRRSAKARAKFAHGTSQHTLQRNRLRALRMAEAQIRGELTAGASARGNATGASKGLA